MAAISPSITITDFSGNTFEVYANKIIFVEQNGVGSKIHYDNAETTLKIIDAQNSPSSISSESKTLFKVTQNGLDLYLNPNNVTLFISSINNISEITYNYQNKLNRVISAVESIEDIKNAIAILNPITGINSQDIEIINPEKGLILMSPNGTRWRITIENDGTLTRTSL